MLEPFSSLRRSEPLKYEEMSEIPGEDHSLNKATLSRPFIPLALVACVRNGLVQPVGAIPVFQQPVLLGHDRRQDEFAKSLQGPPDEMTAILTLEDGGVEYGA
jgi:hypothetical protein